MSTKGKRARCVICGRSIAEEWPHNAHPVAKGQCCGRCNSMVVIPARIRLMQLLQEDE